jgi:hypothetical protein
VQPQPVRLKDDGAGVAIDRGVADAQSQLEPVDLGSLGRVRLATWPGVRVDLWSFNTGVRGGGLTALDIRSFRTSRAPAFARPAGREA